MDPPNVEKHYGKSGWTSPKERTLSWSACHRILISSNGQRKIRLSSRRVQRVRRVHMIKAATINGWLDGERVMMEALTSIKRPG
jgi:hypothetical protein